MIRTHAIKTKHSQYVLMEAMGEISYWIWGRSWDTFRSLSERGQSGRASCSRLLGYCRFSGLLDCIVPPPNSASVRSGSRLHETKQQSINNHSVACKLIRDDVTAGARTFLEEFVAFLFRLQSLFRIDLCETFTFCLHLLHLDTTKAMTSLCHIVARTFGASPRTSCIVLATAGLRCSDTDLFKNLRHSSRLSILR